MRIAGSGLIPVYFEAAAVITTLVLLGQVLELRARSRTSSAIKELLRLAPETATVVFADGTEETIALKDVQMDLSAQLDNASRTGQLYRIDVDVLAPGAWTEVHRKMMDFMGYPEAGASTPTTYY